MEKKMSHEEIMATIHRITAEAIARSKDKEYKMTEKSQSCIDEEIRSILRSASTARKKDYRTYESFKSRISRTGCDYEKYEQSIRELSRILVV